MTEHYRTKPVFVEKTVPVDGLGGELVRIYEWHESRRLNYHSLRRRGDRAYYQAWLLPDQERATEFANEFAPARVERN